MGIRQLNAKGPCGPGDDLPQMLQKAAGPALPERRANFADDLARHIAGVHPRSPQRAWERTQVVGGGPTTPLCSPCCPGSPPAFG